MTTDTTTAEMIPSGVYIFYKCKDEVNKMLPDANDPPFANFMIDIKCDRSVSYIQGCSSGLDMGWVDQDLGSSLAGGLLL